MNACEGLLGCILQYSAGFNNFDRVVRGLLPRYAGVFAWKPFKAGEQFDFIQEYAAKN